MGVTTDDAKAHFGNSTSRLARALGIEPPSVYDWGRFPPPLRQLQLEQITNGALKAEPECDKFRARAA